MPSVLEATLTDWFVLNPLRKTVGGLAHHGLMREGMYLAERAALDEWKPTVSARIAEVLSAELSPNLDDIGKQSWEAVADLARGTAHPQSGIEGIMPAADSRLVNQLYRRYWREMMLVGAGDRLDPLDVGSQLVDKGRLDAGLFVLARASDLERHGSAAVEAIRKVLPHLPKRSVLTATDPALQALLMETAKGLASSRHYSSAVRARLLAPLVEGDSSRFERLASRLLESAGSAPRQSRESLLLCHELIDRGYGMQALDLVAGVAPPTETEQEQWKGVWDEVAQLTRLEAIVLTASKPFAATLGASTGSAGTSVGQGPGAAMPADVPSELSATLDEPKGDGAPEQARSVNTWLDDDANDGHEEFGLWANIGPRQDAAMGGPFREPDWEGRESVQVRLVLSGIDTTVSPGWHDVDLPKTGKTHDVMFRVSAPLAKTTIHLSLRVYTAREMLLLDEHRLQVAIARKAPAT